MTTKTKAGSKREQGRPLKYTSEELKAKLDSYFKNTENKPYSILEICAILGICKDTWNEWEHNEEKGFSDLIKNAKMKVATGWEKGDLNPALSIFLLKNHMKYTDRSEVEHSTPAGRPMEVKHIDYTVYSVPELEELERLALKQQK